MRPNCRYPGNFTCHGTRCLGLGRHGAQKYEAMPIRIIYHILIRPHLLFIAYPADLGINYKLGYQRGIRVAYETVALAAGSPTSVSVRLHRLGHCCCLIVMHD